MFQVVLRLAYYQQCGMKNINNAHYYSQQYVQQCGRSQIGSEVIVMLLVIARFKKRQSVSFEFLNINRTLRTVPVEGFLTPIRKFFHYNFKTHNSKSISLQNIVIRWTPQWSKQFVVSSGKYSYPEKMSEFASKVIVITGEMHASLIKYAGVSCKLCGTIQPQQC